MAKQRKKIGEIFVEVRAEADKLKAELKKIQKSREKKYKNITIRTTLSNCKWMVKHNVSPTKLFNEALNELKEKTK